MKKQQWVKLIYNVTIILWILGFIPYLWEIIASYKISIFEQNTILLLLLILRISQFGKFDLED